MFGRSNTTSGFGGFGSTFGSASSPSSNSAGGGLFGSNNNNASSAFGSNNNAFGSKPSGGLFGSSTIPANNTSPFGSSNTGAFGSNTGSSVFGSTNNNNTGTGLFGSKPTTTAFGSSNNTSVFGNQSTSPFGGASNTGFNSLAATTTNQGTAVKPFTAFTEKDPSSGTNIYENISSMPEYKNFSFEELRAQDYQQGRRFGNQNTVSTGFGSATSSSPFGNSTNANTNTFGGGFGSNTNNANNSTGIFGSTNANNQNSAFGSTFGANNNQSTGSGLFSSANNNSNNAFGAANNNASGGFGSGFGAGGSSAFGSMNNSTTGGGLFGSAKPASPFGSNNNTTGGLFGSNNNDNNNAGTSAFGSVNSGGLFGSNNNNNNAGGFGASTSSPFGATQSKPAFGLGSATNTASTGIGGGFGSAANNNTSGGLFGSSNNNTNNTAGGLFGKPSTPTSNQTGGLFGSKPAVQAGGGLFGTNNTASSTSGGLFGANNNATNGGIFGSKPATGFGSSNNTSTTSGGLFGNKPATTTPAAGGLFGSNNNNTATAGGFGSANNAGGGLFGAQSKPTGAGFSFGNTGTNNGANALNGANGGGLFGNTNGSNNSTTTFGSNTSNGGLFGSKTNNNYATGSSLNSQPFQQQNSSLFANPSQSNNNALITNNGALNTGQQQGQTQQPYKLVATIDQNPYGNNFLFSNGSNELMNVQLQVRPVATPINIKQPKRPSLTSAYNLAPKPLFLANKQNGNSNNNNNKDLAKLEESPKLSIASLNEGSKIKLLNAITDDAILASEIFTPRKNYKNLTIDRSNRTKKSQELAAIENGNDVKNEAKILLDFKPDIDNDGDEIIQEKTKPEKKKFNKQDFQVEEKSAAQDEKFINEEGYWMSPSLEELEKSSLLELRKVKDFTVGREGFGKIEFLQPVDLTTVPNLSQIMGEVILFIYQSCIVYPNDEEKPKKGESLNVPARITLNHCYPISKADKKPIKDANDSLVQRHISKLRHIKNTKFISYDAKTGDWTFTVDQFC